MNALRINTIIVSNIKIVWNKTSHFNNNINKAMNSFKVFKNYYQTFCIKHNFVQFYENF